MIRQEFQRMDKARTGSDLDPDVRQFADVGSGGEQRGIARSLGYFRHLDRIFLFAVIIPTILATLYFGVFASDVYISESRFVVRSPDKPATTGLGILLKSTGFGNAGDEIFAAQDFVTSRDALKALNKSNAFSNAYSDSYISIFDRFNAFSSQATFEDLYKYYQKKIKVEHDTTSSITTLTVRAYDPVDAQLFNEKLLEMSEATVNQLNVRGRQDLIRFAQTEVDDAKEKARSAGLALSAYRNREGVVDPEKQAAVQMQMIAKLQDELIATKTQLLQLRSFTPENPQIEVLDAKVSGLSREIDEQVGLVAGDKRSLSSTAAAYQRLALEAQFADRNLASAMASLEEAKNEARRKQAYVERIVEPNLPDDALEPRRLRGIAATFLLGLISWGILRLLTAGIREHVG
jgi:capsular polysaccharide transport system permease protein